MQRRATGPDRTTRCHTRAGRAFGVPLLCVRSWHPAPLLDQPEPPRGTMLSPRGPSRHVPPLRRKGSRCGSRVRRARGGAGLPIAGTCERAAGSPGQNTRERLTDPAHIAHRSDASGSCRAYHTNHRHAVKISRAFQTGPESTENPGTCRNAIRCVERVHAWIVPSRVFCVLCSSFYASTADFVVGRSICTRRTVWPLTSSTVYFTPWRWNVSPSWGIRPMFAMTNPPRVW